MNLKGQEIIKEGKASVSNVFFKTDYNVYMEFLSKVPKSRINREEILQALLELYNENGDALFNFLFKEPTSFSKNKFKKDIK
jgi:hypothetical protein